MLWCGVHAGRKPICNFRILNDINQIGQQRGGEVSNLIVYDHSVCDKKKCPEISVDERLVCTYCTLGVVPDNSEYGLSFEKTVVR